MKACFSNFDNVNQLVYSGKDKVENKTDLQKKIISFATKKGQKYSIFYEGK
jgi:hypothetical protein